MKSNIIYNGNKCELTEDFTDIGYMAENIEVVDFYGKSKEIKRSDKKGSMTLLISFPNSDEIFLNELLKIDEFLSHIQVDINCYFIFNKEFENQTALKNRLKKFEIVFDSEDEFGNMYGAKIVSGELEDMLTKSLFLISKDGAVFYLDMPSNLEKEFDLQRLQVELNKAYITYTGVGCESMN
ncbi:MAG: redoxin family protein [Campylobacterota bacterium]|nr:redoxin family protein [Campylobacterota bacterium]